MNGGGLTYIALVIHMRPISAEATSIISTQRPDDIKKTADADTHIIEKYGCRFIRGSLSLSAGLRCSSCHRTPHDPPVSNDETPPAERKSRSPRESSSSYPGPSPDRPGTAAHPAAPAHTYPSDYPPKTASTARAQQERTNERTNARISQRAHKSSERQKKCTHDPGQHLVQHRAEAPPVDLVAVRQPLDDLRREVLRRPAERARRVRRARRPPRQILRALAPDSAAPAAPITPIGHPIRRPRRRREPVRGAVPVSVGAAAPAGRRRRRERERARAPRELLREPKVCEHDVPVRGDEDVLRLEVAVDDARGVEALDALDDLRRVEARAVAPEAAPARELRREVAARVEVLRAAVREGVRRLDAERRERGRRTITKKRFSLSWKLHQSLTTNGSVPSAAMRLSTACSVSVCCSSWCASTWRFVIALSAYRSADDL